MLDPLINGARCGLANAGLTCALLLPHAIVWAQGDTAPPTTAPTTSALPAPAEGVAASSAASTVPKAAPPPAPVVVWVVPPGQSATDLALERVPAGVTVEQFLVAVYRLNPGAFAEGRINQLTTGAQIQLPTAAQARALSPERARTELQALRQAAVQTPIPPGQASDGQSAPTASAPASDPYAAAPQAAASEVSPASSAPATAPSGLPIDPLLLISSGAALLTLLFLAFRPREPSARRQGQASAPASDSVESPAKGGRESPLSSPRPKSLADFGPLPSLDLDDGLAHKTSAPAPAAPTAFDLSRISLDLGPQDKRST